MSCEEMILSWARVYASHGKVADPESGRLLAKEFMQLWALPALSAEETEEYMFQAHVALYQIRTKASRVDEYVRVSQVREMLHGPVLGPLLQPSPAADMPRVPFTLLEYKLYHPEVQQHLYDKRKAVRPRALHSIHVWHSPHRVHQCQYADNRIAMFHFALVTWRKVMIAYVAWRATHTAGAVCDARPFVWGRWRYYRRARKTMRHFLANSTEEWHWNSKRLAFSLLKRGRADMDFQHVPATEIQRIWRGYPHRLVRCCRSCCPRSRLTMLRHVVFAAAVLVLWHADHAYTAMAAVPA